MVYAKCFRKQSHLSIGKEMGDEHNIAICQLLVRHAWVEISCIWMLWNSLTHSLSEINNYETCLHRKCHVPVGMPWQTPPIAASLCSQPHNALMMLSVLRELTIYMFHNSRNCYYSFQPNNASHCAGLPKN